MSLGVWATVSLGDWATVSLGDWATVSLGDWATVSLGDWATVSLGDCAAVSLGVWATVSLGDWLIVILGTETNREVKNGKMAEPERFDVHKVENFLKNSADKAQTVSYWNAAVEHGKTVKVTDENLASNVDDKQIADLLLRWTDAINRRDRLIRAVENAIKVKYQPQIPEIFSTVNKEMQSRSVELQQQTSSVGRVQMLMPALQDENQILNYLDLDEKKRAIDRLMDSNEKLREDSIANGKKVDEEVYAAACQELLQKRSDIKTKIEALLKSGDEAAILRNLEDAEQRLADARVNSAADKANKKGTSPQKEPEPDDEQKELDGRNADDRQEPRN